jgi:hypothetical protein
MRRSGAALVLLACLCASALADDDPATVIADLRKQVEEAPTDLDVRLKLAFHLAWNHEWDEARLLALGIAAAAPRYWDAHLLAARIDTWKHDYIGARGRLKTVLDAEPMNVEALTLAADIEFFAGRILEAEKKLEFLRQVDDSAHTYFRSAQVAVARHKSVAAYRFAAQALKREPDHKGAKALQQGVRLIRLDVTSAMEVFPVDDPDLRKGYSETLVLSIFPRGRLGGAISYEYNHRFGTDNHRFGLRGEVRITDRVSLAAFARMGKVEVVPKLTTYAGVEYEVSHRGTGHLYYIFDQMKWPGQLHRLQLGASVQATDSLEVGADFYAGLIRHCRQNSFIQTAIAHGLYTHGRFDIGGRYAFGMELERAPLPPYLEGRYEQDVCFEDVVGPVGEESIKLKDTKAHEVGGYLLVRLERRFHLRAGYEIQMRFNGTNVHFYHLSLVTQL